MGGTEQEHERKKNPNLYSFCACVHKKNPKIQMPSQTSEQYVNYTNVVPDQPMGAEIPQITAFSSTSVSFQAETGCLSGKANFMTLGQVFLS